MTQECAKRHRRVSFSGDNTCEEVSAFQLRSAKKDGVTLHVCENASQERMFMFVLLCALMMRDHWDMILRCEIEAAREGIATQPRTS